MVITLRTHGNTLRTPGNTLRTHGNTQGDTHGDHTENRVTHSDHTEKTW